MQQIPEVIRQRVLASLMQGLPQPPPVAAPLPAQAPQVPQGPEIPPDVRAMVLGQGTPNVPAMPAPRPVMNPAPPPVESGAQPSHRMDPQALLAEVSRISDLRAQDQRDNEQRHNFGVAEAFLSRGRTPGNQPIFTPTPEVDAAGDAERGLQDRLGASDRIDDQGIADEFRAMGVPIPSGTSPQVARVLGLQFLRQKHEKGLHDTARAERERYRKAAQDAADADATAGRAEAAALEIKKAQALKESRDFQLGRDKAQRDHNDRSREDAQEHSDDTAEKKHEQALAKEVREQDRLLIVNGRKAKETAQKAEAKLIDNAKEEKRSALLDAQKNFVTDSGLKKTFVAAMIAGRTILESLSLKGSLADASVRARLPRLYGEVGNMSRFDQQNSAERKGIENYIKDRLSEISSGVWSDEKRLEVQQMVSKLLELHRDNFSKFASGQAVSYETIYDGAASAQEFYDVFTAGLDLPGGMQSSTADGAGQGVGSSFDGAPAGETDPRYEGKTTVMLDEKPLSGSPGSSPDNPINEQHPALAWADRTLIKSIAANPRIGTKHLEKLGFEVAARDEDGGFAIRLPGEHSWHGIENRGWWPELSDISDVWGDAARITGGTVGAIGGAGLGLAGGAPTGPGAVATSIALGTAGGALGAGGVESVLQVVGNAMGLDTTLSEAGGEIAKEAALGALGELGGRTLVGGAKLGAKALGKVGRPIGKALNNTLSKIPHSAKEVEVIANKRVQKLMVKDAIDEPTAWARLAEKLGLKGQTDFIPDVDSLAKLKGRVVEKIRADEPFRKFATAEKARTIDDWFGYDNLPHQDQAVRELTGHPVTNPAVRVNTTKATGEAHDLLVSQAPEPFTLDQVMKDLSDIHMGPGGENAVRSKVNPLLGIQAEHIPLSELPEAATRAQPGVWSKHLPDDPVGLRYYEFARENPGHRKIWNANANREGSGFLGEFENVNIDRIKSLTQGSKSIDFDKEASAMVKFLRGAAKPVGVADKALGFIEKAGPGFGNVGAKMAGPGGRIAGNIVGQATGTRAGSMLARGVRGGIDRIGKALLYNPNAVAEIAEMPGASTALRGLARYAIKSRERGPDAYKAAVWVLTRNPEFRRMAAEMNEEP